jgi:hypothetical protein
VGMLSALLSFGMRIAPAAFSHHLVAKGLRRGELLWRS